MPEIDPDSPETCALLERIARGDRPALERLLARHRPAVHDFVALHLDPRLRADGHTGRGVACVGHAGRLSSRR